MQPRFESPPKITVSLTNSCNLDCKHCYIGCRRAPGSEELACDEWLEFVDYLVDNDFIQVYFEGGEPFHRPDFLRILRHCARRLMTWVRTNGTLVTSGVARELREIGVGGVLVDLMGSKSSTHDWFTGTEGSFELACDAIRHLATAGVRTDVLTVLTKRNVSELQQLLQIAHSLGAKRAGVLRLYPIGRAKARWKELALSLEEQEAAIASLSPPRGLGLMQSWHPNDHNCCWQSAAVTATGNSIGCVYLREYVDFGNIRNTPFLDTWHGHPLYRQLRSGHVKRSCPGCKSSQGTFGGCRSTAYAFHGRWDAPDPFCSTMNDGVDLRVLPERLLQESAKPQGPPGS